MDRAARWRAAPNAERDKHLATGAERELFTTWIPGEGGPEDFYLRFGFEATGRTIDGEVEARLARWPAASPHP